MATDSRLTAISPLDGRYHTQLTEVSNIFSEFALITHRVKIEIQYLFFLSKHRLIPKITSDEEIFLLQLQHDFSTTDAEEVKKIELITRHDVKAVEYFLTAKLQKINSPLAAYVHIALTSEDVNSLAYSQMLMEAKEQLVIPMLQLLLKTLGKIINDYADTPMLARTHGQVAVPTTIGKEFAVFAQRLLQELLVLDQLQIEGKVSGAVGNFNAHLTIFPDVDWLKISKEFVASLGLAPSVIATQILSPESYSQLFSSLIRINGILLDLNQDAWRYISDGYLVQKLATGQVGSSTMPHKVNPIDFENSEGNLGMANSMLIHFIQKLPISRLQRDLSDSTVKRNFGVAIGQCVLAYTSLIKGLQKISVDTIKVNQELNDHWEVVAEAYQVILRMHGDVLGYQKLQEQTQGKKVTKKILNQFVAQLQISDEIKQQLLQLSPTNYLGLSAEIAATVHRNIRSYLKSKGNND